jgi:type VI secretion system protein ImpL
LAGGQVLEVAGNFFEPSSNDDAEEKEWKALLTRMQRERPQRPLDGIILTLPATHLAGESALSADELRRDAAQMEKQLKLLRDQLGFSLPLYLVITKCDAIPGYTTFVEVQRPHAGEIFGWSNPYNLDASFNAAWTAQAFAEIERVLSGERARFFARQKTGTTKDLAAADEFFLFPARLAELERPAAAYLEKLLENSGHRDGLLFRGIYFAGSAAHNSQAFDETRSRSNGTNRVGFTADLFQRKIFPERGLARPVATALAGRNIEISIYRTLCLVLLLVLFPGAIYGWYSLSKSAPEISRHLRQTCKGIRAASSQDVAPCGAGNEADASPAYSTIYAAQALSGSNFQSVFLPASLIDPLDTEAVMARAFNQLVYPGLEDGLEQRTQELLRSKEAATPQPTPENAQSLTDFTEAFLKLEENIIFYNKLARGDGSGKDMMALGFYLSPETFQRLRRWDTSGLDDIIQTSFTPAYERWGRAARLDTLRWNPPALAKLKEMATHALEQSTHEKSFRTRCTNLPARSGCWKQTNWRIMTI